MKISEVFGLYNAINQLLQERLETSLIFKLHKTLKLLEPEIKSTQETLNKVRDDNKDETQVETIYKNAEQKLLKDDSELVIEPIITQEELPPQMQGTILVHLMPIIQLEEENE